MSKIYDRNIPGSKFYSTARIGHKGYNPKIIMYYDNSDNLIRIEEIFGNKKYGQTISGSNFAQNWPNYSYKVVYNPWIETTYSG